LIHTKESLHNEQHKLLLLPRASYSLASVSEVAQSSGPPMTCCPAIGMTNAATIGSPLANVGSAVRRLFSINKTLSKDQKKPE
jgi:hypothetical protein